MENLFQTISPVDGRVYTENQYATQTDIKRALEQAQQAQCAWRDLPIGERAALCTKAIDAFTRNSDAVSAEISWQMGRPIQYAPGEVKGFAAHARYMIGIAEQKLQDIIFSDEVNFTRFIKRTPLGIVMCIVPWNYPYLTAVNTIIPALMAGNAVIMKPSAQTPLCAQRLFQAFTEAGLPPGIFQYLYLDHHATQSIIQHSAIDFVAFTGSVKGGIVIQEAIAQRFIGRGLELGGKDPAYVRADADLAFTVPNLIEGAFFNSGQSCCGIERIYVHADLFSDFVDQFVSGVRQLQLGNPLDPNTTLGPMTKLRSKNLVSAQIDAAILAGATPCINPDDFSTEFPSDYYLAPQVLINVDHTMRVMQEENFGPVVGIMSVASDEAAITLMNDSQYGLTASLWTQDENAALKLGTQVQTGTCFMNRCDYLDPALAWTGVKHSGHGCTLSEIGYEQLTQPKSFHFRHSH